MTITCENITHIYRQGKQEDVTALRNCQLHLPEHSVTVLLGISGSGKSTLLRLIGLQEYPTSGRILFDSVDVTRLSESERSRMRARDIGFIHQNYRLIPMLTVEENILLPGHITGKAHSDDDLRKLTRLLQIDRKLSYFPASLSGGQQQRVAIARALINRPQLILADEPTGNLDHATKQDMIRLFAQIHREYAPTLLIVTHDPAFAEIADCVCKMENGSPIPVS